MYTEGNIVEEANNSNQTNSFNTFLKKQGTYMYTQGNTQGTMFIIQFFYQPYLFFLFDKLFNQQTRF